MTYSNSNLIILLSSIRRFQEQINILGNSLGFEVKTISEINQLFSLLKTTATKLIFLESEMVEDNWFDILPFIADQDVILIGKPSINIGGTWEIWEKNLEPDRIYQYLKQHLNYIETKKSKKYLDLIFENARDSIVFTELESKKLYVLSRTSTSLLGWTKEELENADSEKFLASVHPEDRDIIIDARIRINEILARRYKTGFSVTYRIFSRNFKKDKTNEYIWINNIVSPVYSEDGNPAGYLQISRDVTEEIGRRIEIDTHRNLVQTMMDALPVGIVLLDSKGKLISWNASFSNVSELKPRINASFFNCIGINPQNILDANELKRILEIIENPDSLTTSKEFHFSIPFIDSEKEEKNLCMTLYPVNKQILVVIKDETREVKQQKATEMQKALLIESQRLASVGEMAAGIAHEMKQPLNVVRLNVQLLMRLIEKGERLEDHTKDILNAIEQSVLVLSSIIDSVRKLTINSTNLISDNIEQPLRIVHVNDVCNEILNIMNRQLKQQLIELEIKIEEDLAVYVVAGILEQILTNLILNARDALLNVSPSKRKLKITACKCNESYLASVRTADIIGTDYALITVTDTGSGISERIRDKVFLPFFSTKDPAKGAGLGLSISYKLAKDNGGDLWFETGSSYTAFYLILPLAILKQQVSI
ncbi:MAG: PAS domain S-box protein [Candidatus Coatesbacteria bacterium]|nr:PAS domain S-box protein [Candidatus Coatesbacteria bacterium]